MLTGTSSPVHGSFQEPRPIREQFSGSSIDEHTSSVKGDAGVHARGTILLRVAFRHEQQCVEGEWRIGAEMQPEERLVVVMRLVLVEFSVFRVRRLVAVSQP
jgi:hypothetical protein